MRVFAVAQRLDEAAAKSAKIGRRVVKLRREPAGDGGVIGRGPGKSLGGQAPAQCLCRHALMLGACEPDGGAVLRNLSAEVEVIEVAGLTVGYDVAAGFNCLLKAA